jgi:hypothetical protein
MRNKRLPSKQVKIAISVALVSLALMVVSFSCSSLLPTAPETKTALIEEEDWGTPCNPIAPEDVPFDWTEFSMIQDEGWFGPNGYVITQVVDCVQLQFRVPPGALNDSTYITVQSSFFARNLQGKVYKKLELEFGPDGLVFSVPATLKFASVLLGAGEGDELILRWFDPESESWVVVQKVIVNPGLSLVTFEISHFSRYAISTSVQPTHDK